MHRSRTPLAAILLSLALAAGARAQDRAERAEAYLRSFHDLRRFNGAALVIDRGRVLFEGGFGLADMERALPATADTRFRIGSLAESFTAALVLRLEEEGRLDLEAPVSRYLEEAPGPEGDRITLHHLLAPASGPQSSDSGYVLLARIAERVTGTSYARLLEEMVLGPAGLEHTGYDAPVDPGEGHARGYARTLVGYEPAPAPAPAIPGATGTLSSTVGDLGRWMSGLLGRGASASPFRDPATGRGMLGPDLAGHGYGLAVRERPIGRDPAVRVVESGGGIPGFSSLARVFPDHERLIVLLDNTSSDLGPIAEGLTNLLWGAEAVAPKPSIAERLLPIVESAGVGPALERYRDWRRTRPDRYEYEPAELLRLARHFHAGGDAPTAIEILEAQVAEEPGLVLSRHALSEMHAELGDTARAVAHVEAALGYRPGDPRLLERAAALGAEVDPILALPVVEVEPSDLERLVGEYVIDPATSLVVELAGRELTARRTGEGPFRLLPQSAATFLLRGSKIQLSFAVVDGRAASVSVLEQGRRLTFPRASGPP